MVNSGIQGKWEDAGKDPSQGRVSQGFPLSFPRQFMFSAGWQKLGLDGGGSHLESAAPQESSRCSLSEELGLRLLQFLGCRGGSFFQPSPPMPTVGLLVSPLCLAPGFRGDQSGALAGAFPLPPPCRLRPGAVLGHMRPKLLMGSWF